jgi:hypothetical protein
VVADTALVSIPLADTPLVDIPLVDIPLVDIPLVDIPLLIVDDTLPRFSPWVISAVWRRGRIPGPCKIVSKTSSSSVESGVGAGENSSEASKGDGRNAWSFSSNW